MNIIFFLFRVMLHKYGYTKHGHHKVSMRFININNSFKTIPMKMICQICFHPRTNNPHICLPLTCTNCFSPKEIHDMYCLECKTTTSCFFCQNPSTHKYQGLRLCPKHLVKSCETELYLRNIRRAEYNRKYEESCINQRNQRTIKSGAPRLAKRKITFNRNARVFNSIIEAQKSIDSFPK